MARPGRQATSLSRRDAWGPMVDSWARTLRGHRAQSSDSARGRVAKALARRGRPPAGRPAPYRVRGAVLVGPAIAVRAEMVAPRASPPRPIPRASVSDACAIGAAVPARAASRPVPRPIPRRVPGPCVSNASAIGAAMPATAASAAGLRGRYRRKAERHCESNSQELLHGIASWVCVRDSEPRHFCPDFRRTQSRLGLISRRGRRARRSDRTGAPPGADKPFDLSGGFPYFPRSFRGPGLEPRVPIGRKSLRRTFRRAGSQRCARRRFVFIGRRSKAVFCDRKT
jgi:hypothetical protein